MSKYVMNVVQFGLNHSAEDILSVRVHERIKSWLPSWTLVNNIPMVLCDSQEEGVEKLRSYCQELLKFHQDFNPKAFCFKVGVTKIEPDGSFYTPSGMSSEHHPVIK